MKEPNLIVMCGLQCSGKSTKAKELKEKYNAEIISSDSIREEFKDITNEQVFKILYERVNNCLKENKNVIIDATNTTIKMRQQIFNNIKEPCYKICYIVNTPFNICLKRLKERNLDYNNHFVPIDILGKYYRNFEIPFYEEGWNSIKIDQTISYEKSENNIETLLKMSKGFNQQTKYHTQDLFTHMYNTGKYLENIYGFNNFTYGAYLHDLGKLFSQSFKENDPNAHYYNHANIGTYNLLCSFTLFNKYNVRYTLNKGIKYKPDIKGTLEILFYINYHMHLYNIKTEKAENKWRKIFGEEKYLKLKELNIADRLR